MKQKKQLAVLVVLLVSAGAVWFWYFQPDRTAMTDPADSPAKSAQLLSVENPAIHWHILEGARKTEYKSSGRNIFTTAAPLPASAGSDKAKPDVVRPPYGPTPPAPDPDPVLPPNIKFFGYGTVLRPRPTQIRYSRQTSSSSATAPSRTAPPAAPFSPMARTFMSLRRAKSCSIAIAS